jgi:hypothetical protein
MIRGLVLGLVAAACLAAGGAPPASDVMQSAQKAALEQHKNIFLIFHASWCGWCAKLDKFIETPEIKPIFDKYFVFARLDVQEAEEKKDLDNPGGEQVMAKVGGEKAGLPFLAFLSEKGELLANSIRPGDDKAKAGNIGHPMQPYEVDWFLTMLKKGAPAITADEAKVLENWLRAQKK